MPAKKQVKRTVATNGEVRYFEGGKRITAKKGKLKFVQQNYDILTNPYKDKPSLSDKERQTLQRVKTQKELFRYKGVPIKREITDFMAARGYIDQKTSPRDITKIVSPGGNKLFRSYGQFEQAYARLVDQFRFTTASSMYGAAGWRGRTQNQGVVNLFENISILGRDGWKLNVIDLDGKDHRGQVKGMEAIREFEEMITQDLSNKFDNLAAVSFDYQLEWDFKTKTIIVNLSEARAQERTSDPKGITKN
jgi:hypothetical protein